MEKSGSTVQYWFAGQPIQPLSPDQPVWSGSNNLDLWSDVVEVISFLGCYLKLGH